MLYFVVYVEVLCDGGGVCCVDCDFCVVFFWFCDCDDYCVEGVCVYCVE